MEILVVDVEVERRLARAEAIGAGGFLGDFGRRRFGRRDLLAGAGVEQRVTLDLLGDEALDLDVRQSQQADRLLQLRGHHQRLALAEVEAGADRHGGP